MLSNLLGAIIDTCPIFNQPCVLCASRRARHGWCQPCRDSLTRLPSPHCPRCATPLLQPGLCGRCQHHPPAFDALHAPLVFCYPLDALIHAFKYGKRLELAGALSTLLLQFAPPLPLDTDLVIPVPLSKERLADRGFNQSDELARALAGTMAQRFVPDLCGRKRNTPSQTHLNLRERRRNLQNAFCVKSRLDGLSVAIVDDVATTGTTLDTLAVMLKKQGAKRVEAWALARTLTIIT